MTLTNARIRAAKAAAKFYRLMDIARLFLYITPDVTFIVHPAMRRVRECFERWV